MKKPRRAAADSSPLSVLPDEIIFEIVNKIIELKTLCFCKLVSKRFYSIVLQVHAISLTALSDFDWKTCNCAPFFKCESLCLAAVRSMQKFRCVKSLCIELPLSTQQQQEGFLSKWKIKFGNNVEKFVFLSPNAIYDTNSKRLLVDNNVNGQEVEEEEEDEDLSRKKFDIALGCYLYAFKRFIMLFNHISYFPLLEKISIRDSSKKGRISVNGGGKTKIGEMRECRYSSCSIRSSLCYIPLLELPISGYTMKGVTLVLVDESVIPDGDESFMASFEDHDFEDKEEVVYGEAMMEIFKKHRGSIRWLQL